MKTLKHIWFIALKDLKIFVTDRGLLFFALAFPLLFITLFSVLMSGIGSEDPRLHLCVATQEDPSGISHLILGAMETSDESLLKPGEPVIVWEKDYEAARRAVDEGNLGGFIYFPADFTEKLLSSAPIALEIYVDAGNTTLRAALSGTAGAIASRLNTQQAVIQASVTALIHGGVISDDPSAVSEVVQEMMAGFLTDFSGETGLVNINIEKVGEVSAGNAADWVVPGYLVMFVFFAAALSSETIVRERDNNTLERLLSTSVTREAIIGGIFAGTALRGIVQIVIFWAFGILVFKVDMGASPAGIVVLSLLMVIMSSAFAVMLASLAKTRRSANSLALITGLVMAPLGGCWWPLFLYPSWLQTAAKITPHAWAMSAFNKLMLFGADFGAAVPEMLALLVFTVIFASIAVARFRTSAM